MAGPRTQLNTSTRAKMAEAREFSLRIINDPDYRANLLERARKGNLQPQIEQLLYYYAFGKPVDNIAVEVSENPQDMSSMTTEQLQEKLNMLATVLKSADALSEENAAEQRATPAPPKSVIH